MRIDHLELINFKNYNNLSVNFQPGVNLLVGSNGSGKTSLLEGVNVAVGGFFASRTQKFQRPIKENEIRLVKGDLIPVRSPYASVYAKSALINGPWLRKKNSDGLKDKSIGKIIGESGIVKNGRTIRIVPKKIGVDTIKEYGAHFFDYFENNNDRTIAPLIAYYSTQRLFSDAKQTKEQKYDAPNGRRNGYLQCLEENAIKPVLNEWLGNAVTRRATKQINNIVGTDNVLENVEQAIKNVVKDFLNVSELKIFQDPDFEFDVFLQFDEETPLPINYYSDGFRNLIYLVIDMVWRASQLNPWLNLQQITAQVTGIVTIDEIDLHLHPKWQSKVIKFIQKLFPNVQFFITTHSPTVVANFEGGSLYVIDDNKINIHNDKYFGKAVNTVLRDVLGAQDRHIPTQDKINRLLKEIGNEAPVEVVNPLLDELTGLLGLEDIDIQRALSLIEWNKIKNEDDYAIHS